MMRGAESLKNGARGKAKSNQPLRRKSGLILICFLMLSFSACATQRSSAKKLDDRITKVQHSLGIGVASQPTAVAPAAGLNVQSPAGYVQFILNQLVNASPLRGSPIHSVIVNDSSLNASANGLTVKVNSGFLLMFGNDKDIVASVMAHELGHILANHQPKNYAFPRALFQAASPLLSFVPYGGYAGTAINEGANMQVARYSRIQENEADAIGAILAADAGFDPHGLSRFLEMASRCACSGSGFPSGLSIPTSVSSIPTSVAVPLLRTSPLYRSHPNYAARQRIIDLVVQRKAGRITSEQLHSAEPWLAGIYDTLERKRPKQP